MRWYASLGASSEIVRLRRRGRRATFETLSTFWLAGGERSRVAVTASKAVGPAVVRNLVRRRLQGALDGLPQPSGPVRIVFVAKPVAAQAPYARLAGDVAAALDRVRAV